MDSNNSLQGTNKTDGALSNETSTTAVGENKAYNIGADLLFRHRFTKPGRTLSWMLSGRMSNTDGSNRSDFTDLLYSSLEQNIPEEHSQLKNNIKKQYSFRSNLTFTEKYPMSFSCSWDISSIILIRRTDKRLLCHDRTRNPTSNWMKIFPACIGRII